LIQSPPIVAQEGQWRKNRSRDAARLSIREERDEKAAKSCRRRQEGGETGQRAENHGGSENDDSDGNRK